MSWDSDVVPFREPLAPGTLLQNGLYRIGQLVGQGNFGLTYAAQQRPGRLPVAIKEFFPEGCWREDFQIIPGPPWSETDFAQSVEAFVQEGSILERFHHAGIVRVLGLFRTHRTAYLVEELLEGVTLGEGLAQAGTMTLDRALEMARQVGDALNEVHAQGLVHSDLKPDNLFFTDQGRYVILDFGTAHSYRSDEATARGVAAVTPGYSPLEQYQRDQKLTPAADVYALAATLYHMLQGYPPPDARERSRGAHLMPLETASLKVERALADALHLHPLRRTPGVGPFLEQLGVEFDHSLDSTPWMHGFKGLGERSAHLGATSTLALHAASSCLYSGGQDGRWCAWSWPDLKPIFSQQGHRSPIRAMAVSSNGRYLVSGAQDGSVKLWPTQERAEAVWLVAAGPAVRGLQFHPLRGFVVAAFADGSCRLLGPSLSQEVQWQAHEGAINSIDIHPAGSLLASAAEDQKIYLWDLAQGSLTGTLSTHGPAHSARFSADGTGLLVCSGANAVGLWDVESLRQVRVFFGHRAEVWDARFSSQSNLILTLSADHNLYAYRADSGRMVISSQVTQGHTGALVVDPHNHWLATGGTDGRVKAWKF